jgi:Skp family chaperone for outer membrane proteins
MTLSSIVFATLLSAAPSQVGSQSPGSPNIAVVNLARLFEHYQMTSDLEQIFDERRQSVAASAQKRREEVDVMRTGLERFKPGSPDFARREEELVRAEIEFQVWLEMQERLLKSQHKQSLQQIYRDTRQAVAKLATERRIDLVLTYDELEEEAPDSVAFKQQILLKKVIFASGRIDLTETVLAMVNSEYQKRGGAAAMQLGSVNPAPRGAPVANE